MPVNTRSVLYSFDGDAFLCPLVFDSSAFRHRGFVFFPLLFPLYLKRLISPATSRWWWLSYCAWVVLVPAVVADCAQNWDVVYQFCENSLFHPHLIFSKGGMCWQEINLHIYICYMCFLESGAWFKRSAKFGILCFKFVFLQDCLSLRTGAQSFPPAECFRRFWQFGELFAQT